MRERTASNPSCRPPEFTRRHRGCGCQDGGCQVSGCRVPRKAVLRRGEGDGGGGRTFWVLLATPFSSFTTLREHSTVNPGRLRNIGTHPETRRLAGVVLTTGMSPVWGIGRWAIDNFLKYANDGRRCRIISRGSAPPPISRPHMPPPPPQLAGQSLAHRRGGQLAPDPDVPHVHRRRAGGCRDPIGSVGTRPLLCDM